MRFDYGIDGASALEARLIWGAGGAGSVDDGETFPGAPERRLKAGREGKRCDTCARSTRKASRWVEKEVRKSLGGIQVGLIFQPIPSFPFHPFQLIFSLGNEECGLSYSIFCARGEPSWSSPQLLEVRWLLVLIHCFYYDYGLLTSFCIFLSFIFLFHYASLFYVQSLAYLYVAIFYLFAGTGLRPVVDFMCLHF